MRLNLGSEKGLVLQGFGDVGTNTVLDVGLFFSSQHRARSYADAILTPDLVKWMYATAPKGGKPLLTDCDVHLPLGVAPSRPLTSIPGGGLFL